MNIFPKLPLKKVVSTFLLTAVLFVVTAFNNSFESNASLIYSSNLIAAANQSETTYPTDDNQVKGVLYSNSDQVKSLNSVDDFVAPQTQKALNDPAQIPAVKQPIIDRSNPDNRLLEKTKQMFEDAADFSAN